MANEQLTLAMMPLVQMSAQAARPICCLHSGTSGERSTPWAACDYSEPLLCFSKRSVTDFALCSVVFKVHLEKQLCHFSLSP